MCSVFRRIATENFCRCDPCYAVSVVFSRFPFLTLFSVFLSSVILCWLGVSWHGLPVFEDPYLGFETRGTPVAKKLVALENLREEFKRLEVIENYPGERLANRESRRKREYSSGYSHLDFCTKDPLEEYSRVAVEIEDGYDLFSGQVMGRLCRFQNLMESTEEYKYMCEKDGHRNCCPAWSLPNYVSLFSNKSTCSDLEDVDIVKFRNALWCCIQSLDMGNKTLELNAVLQPGCPHTSEARDNSTKSPDYCRKGGFVDLALRHTLEKNFPQTNVSQFSMVVLPIPKNPLMPPILEDLLHLVENIHLPDSVVALGGFDFGTKDELFKELLISDLKYVVVASVIIFMIVCCYTKSVLVTAISYGALSMSLGISYFLYKSVLCISYFPFMNMLVTIIVLGIGTDGTLILSVAWRTCRNHLSDEPFDRSLKLKMMEHTLKETTSTLFIATCTTAAAFFASLTSSITTIRCFSIFAGTSITVSFFLLYITVPTGLLASDILVYHWKALFPAEEKNTLISKILKLGAKIRVLKATVQERVCHVKIIDLIQTLTTTKLSAISFLVLAGIFVWGSFVVFSSPGFQLPNSEQFQLLSYNHPVEKYDRVIEPLFNIGNDGDREYDNLTFYFVWGVKSLDNGDYLNPNDEGVLDFDESFSLADTDSQNWMLEFCKKLKNQTFYALEANMAGGANFDGCMLDTMIKWMDRDCAHRVPEFPSHEPCCNVSKFPYDAQIFSKCVGLASRDIYRTPINFFRPDIAGPKFFTTYANANRSEVPEWDDSYMRKKKMPVFSRMGELATFTVRARTNFLYSISYEKMAEIYGEASGFFGNALRSAPSNLKNGFFISAHFSFFDLQHSLLHDTWHSLLVSSSFCFFFICVASRSLLVSLGAVAAILSTVVVSSAVLIEVFSWKLGVFESIAVTVAVGLSDFTAHHSIEFAKRRSITKMTSPTFFSAVTTVVMGLAMALFSQVLVYQQIGYFFFVLVLTCWFYSVFFLSPLLILLDIVSASLVSLLAYIPYIYECATRRRWSCGSHTEDCDDNRFAEERNDYRAGCDCQAEQYNGNHGALLPESDGVNESQSQERNNLTMERWKLLKKTAQETTV